MSITMNRRTVLQTAAAGALAATGVPAVAAPRRGGTLRLGLKAQTHLIHGMVVPILTVS